MPQSTSFPPVSEAPPNLEEDSATDDNASIEIDALALRDVKRHFLALNTDRLRRVQDSLEARQRMFIELLPLLFHINHPMLPGYISNETPCGICDYSPGQRSLRSAQKLARSFSFQRRAQRRYSIHALYMMGSTGTIAYSKSSDFDIWVCHRPELSETDHSNLLDKCESITSWAETIGLEVHFFLMDEAEFRAQSNQHVSKENAGSAQHHLLLDEFYRTSLLIAGRYPIWWLVPAEHESNYEKYVHKLISNRFIKDTDIVDFGGLHSLPREEFFGATLWHLYKAVDSPYKSILKILLMEAYASQYPNTDLLAVRFKKLVHRADTGLDQLDPYVMMCNTIEEYLFSQKQLDRLDLVRRCFYFKVNESLSKASAKRDASWRYEAVRELVTSWGWEQSKLEVLDQRAHWKIGQVTEERTRLINELTQSYRALSKFSRDSDKNLSINPDDLNRLGRKLYVAFERKAGKIEMVNPGISDDLSEELLSIHYIDNEEQQSWSIYRGNVLASNSNEHTPLKRFKVLLELLAWCHFNGLIQDSFFSSVSVQPPECPLDHWELRCVIDALQQLFPQGELPPVNLDALANPAYILEAGLFINLARDPMEKLSRHGMQLVSERIDPLSYGSRWENLAISFDLIVINSWNEVLTFHYHGRTSLLDCLCDYFAWNPISSGHRLPHIPCASFSSSRGTIIARRLEELYQDISDYFYYNYWRNYARYALRLGKHYYLLQIENDSPRYLELNSKTRLLNELGNTQQSFSPIRFDPQSVAGSELPLVMSRNSEGVVQLFYQKTGDRTQIYILDERGSLYHQRFRSHELQVLLLQYQIFLESIHYRMKNGPQESSLSTRNDTQFFKVADDPMGDYLIEEVQVIAPLNARGFFDVQLMGGLDDTDDTQIGSLSIFYNNREFSSLQSGNKLYREVVEHIINETGDDEYRPIYITDLELNSADHKLAQRNSVQSIDYLSIKKRVENQLNGVLQQALQTRDTEKA